MFIVPFYDSINVNCLFSSFLPFKPTFSRSCLFVSWGYVVLEIEVWYLLNCNFFNEQLVMLLTPVISVKGDSNILI